MISALHLAYRTEETRSWFKIRAIANVLTLLMSALLLTALLLVLVSGHVFDWIGARLRLEPIVVELGKILQWPAAIVFVMLSYLLLYYAGPTLIGRRWHWVTPGSAFGTLLWFVASLGFRGYLHFFNTYSTTYGSLGAVMILLVWLYVSGLAFLIGGEINAEIERAACGLALQT
jgi:membrane protein